MIYSQKLIQIPQLTGTEVEWELRHGALILDTRETKQFASFHISGALQIGLMGSFASWAAVLIEPSQKLVLVTDSANRAQEAQNRLARVGLKEVIGYTLADKKRWQQDGIKLAELTTHAGEKFRRELQKDHSLQLIDVRSSAEWLKGHLSGALSMPLLEIHSKIRSLDSSKPTLVYCEEGYRATIAASILLQNEFPHVSVLVGGIGGWEIDEHAVSDESQATSLQYSVNFPRIARITSRS